MGLLKIAGVGCILAVTLGWVAFILRGKQFALRDHLRKADAIVVLAGTRGNINFLNGKIHTAVKLFHQGWAPCMIFTGKFSVKVTDTPNLIPAEELLVAAAHGRIQEKDVPAAAQTWDAGLGAAYMRDIAVELGVPLSATIIEDEALHTRENAEQVAKILETHEMKSIILVTSPFHQLRTFLTFAKVMKPKGIEIINYYADTGEWHPLTWFLSVEHRRLVSSETERIQKYREKGDLL